MSIGDIFGAAVILLLIIALARILTRRFREDARVLLGRHKYSSRTRLVPGTDETLAAEVRGMLAEGEKREAVKHVREMTGLSPEAARERVDAIDSESPAAAPELSLTQLISLARELTPEVRRLVKAGRKTDAVTLIRRRTGMEESTAKKIVGRMG